MGQLPSLRLQQKSQSTELQYRKTPVGLSFRITLIRIDIHTYTTEQVNIYE